MVVQIANQSEKQGKDCCICGKHGVEFRAVDNGKEYFYCGRCAPYIGEHINGDNDN